MKVYQIIFQVPEKTLRNMSNDLNYDRNLAVCVGKNLYRGMYAWTTDKHIFKDYCEERSIQYTILKTVIDKVDEDELNELRSQYGQLELDDYELKTRKNKMKTESEYLLCTRSEYNGIEEHANYWIYEEMDNVAKHDYRKYKSKYECALMILHYPHYYYNAIYGLFSGFNDDDFDELDIHLPSLPIEVAFPDNYDSISDVVAESEGYLHCSSFSLNIPGNPNQTFIEYDVKRILLDTFHTIFMT